MSFRVRSSIVWFAVGGGACAFAVQMVAGIMFGFARCNPGGAVRGSLSVGAWQAAVAGAALVVGLASFATAAWLFKRTYKVGDIFASERRGDGSPPPLGRVHFLSQMGLVVNLLTLVIIVMDGIGAPLHELCQQA